MKLKMLLVALLVCAQFTPLPAQAAKPRAIAPVVAANNPAPAGQTLPIKRVILYSNGVAYIERRGTVTGRAEVNLSFKQSQVDDVLKSMVVLDLGQGRIGAVSYNSSAPPAARMADIPFAIDASTGAGGGLAGVLAQLQGAKVLVATATRTATGAILTVEERKEQIDAQKPAVTKHTLVLTAEGGELLSFDLAEVRSIKLLDEGARKDITEFADATASARRRDAKTITVTSDGNGAREMVVSYTIAAPIWKTNYRVVLDQTGKPFFQGWAIVDNVSDEDWENVQLSLVSGTPVSFIQPIQKPFYRYRPVVPMPSDLQLTPQVYEPGQQPVGEQYGYLNRAAGADSNAPPPATLRFATGQSAPADNKALNDQRAAKPVPRGDGNRADEEKAPVSVGNAIASGNAGAQTAATGGEVGDLFEYKIAQPITVRRDRSALIPIVQTKMDGERASIYNEGVRRDRPMGGLLLKNTTGLTLEAGAITVIDGDAYAGEALMERLKNNEQRLISFALDLGTLVNATQKQDREPTYFIRALNGVFETFYYQTDEKVYALTNQTDKPRVVFIEHPLRPDWEISDKSAKPYNVTARYYRFRVELGPGEKKEVPVIERHRLSETFQLAECNKETLELFISRRYLDDATRAALEKIIALNSQIAALDARVEAMDKENEEIASDQGRLRENIETLKGTAGAQQLIARYLAKVNKQETRIEQIEEGKKIAEKERERLQEQLDVAVRAIAINRELDKQ